ncbi:hypothetical protein ACFFU9_07985 [Mariniflexile ostreae]|uniref:Lipoprotein n=1 Tax=Mariniflexile ostreae TaxID=1520892 RepID=A0ABV5FB57_9FLAO
MRYTLIFLLNLFFLSCSSIPNEYLANDDACHYTDPIFKITKEELFLNPNILKQSKDENGDIVLTDNKNYKNLFSVLSGGYIANYQTNKKLGIDKWVLYRKNRTIKRVSFIYLNGTKEISQETHYDEKGNITKIIDYEKGYKICWKEAIEIVKKIAKKDIEKYEIKGYNLSHNNLNEFPNGNPEWQISLDGNEEYEEKDTKIYAIDGVTGKLIRTYKITMEHY